MTAEQLRNSILQEAISGRLVPQDPNDEPASVLLQRIREEKVRLVKEGKLKKKDLVETPIVEEIPFEIPSSWEWVKFGNVINLLSGRDLAPNEYNAQNEGIPYITGASCIQHETIIVNRWTKHPVVIASINDILISCKGTIGKIAINTIGDCHIARQIMAVQPILLDLMYVRYFMETLTATLKNNALSMIPGISRENILDAIIPLPPLVEQKHIVAKLEELLPIVDQYGKAQSELDQLNAALPSRLRQSILQEAISGKLVPQDENDEDVTSLINKIQEDRQRLVKEKKVKAKDVALSTITNEEYPYDTPNNWAWLRISDLCYITNGFTPLRTEPRFWTNGSISWFTVEDIRKQGEIINYTSQKITPAATSQERIVRAGSTLLCCTASVGQCAITNIPLTTNQQFNALTIKEWFMPIVDDKYLYWFAKTLAPTLHSLAGQTTFEFVSVKKVGNILIPLPPLAEQQRIVAKIEDLFEQIDKISK